MKTRHLRLLVEYDGTRYAGFQRQKNAPTIQAELERALRECLQHAVTVHAAGRTDAGVHAVGQVCKVATTASIPADRLPLALNRLLPAAIVVRAARETAASWHPRYSASSRVYRYTIDNQPIRSALRVRYAHHVVRPLDTAAMQTAARHLIGTHDFASFQASGSASEGTVRELKRLDVRRHGTVITVTIEANAFLYQMVRIVVGTLIQIGHRARAPEEMRAILSACRRNVAGPTAPPHGLCLMRVKYGRRNVALQNRARQTNDRQKTGKHKSKSIA